MNKPCLILHKVRGEPTFDVAERLDGAEPLWIIPTSGHRAYPYWYIPLEELLDDFEELSNDTPKLDWPDHYPAPSKVNRLGVVLEQLGITDKEIDEALATLRRRPTNAT